MVEIGVGALVIFLALCILYPVGAVIHKTMLSDTYEGFWDVMNPLLGILFLMLSAAVLGFLYITGFFILHGGQI